MLSFTLPDRSPTQWWAAGTTFFQDKRGIFREVLTVGPGHKSPWSPQQFPLIAELKTWDPWQMRIRLLPKYITDSWGFLSPYKEWVKSYLSEVLEGKEKLQGTSISWAVPSSHVPTAVTRRGYQPFRGLLLPFICKSCKGPIFFGQLLWVTLPIMSWTSETIRV